MISMFGLFSSKKTPSPPKVKKKGIGGFFSGICGDSESVVDNKTPTAGAAAAAAANVLSQKLTDKAISLDEYDHMSEQLYASSLSNAEPHTSWGEPQALPNTLKHKQSGSAKPALTTKSQAALQQVWAEKIQRLMDASIKEMNRPGLTNEEKRAVATKWLAIINKMNRHTQKWLPDLEEHLLAAEVKVAEAEDYKLEHPEPDRAFFIGYDDDY